ncbi:hypothetical protein [Paraclostridium bifermentans]|uniref:hypothetical protein n=1 Tax=Paraclostridium bifermentans TaxID=1490 RepID=UPI001C8127CB|nr:hypothetical protein [Paraclostridium bifermentans]GIM32945.1 hypothetical protein PAGU1678_22150 [Paraclostridium bifermentans subsp. muricolitidis]
MDIKKEAMVLAGIVKDLCKERNLEIENIINKGNEEFNSIWIAAVEIFKMKMGYEKECKECKKSKNNIEDLELLAKRKKTDWEGKVDLMQEGVVIGLDMALTMMK